MSRYIFQALYELTNGAEYIWRGDNLADIEWLTPGITTPTQKQIDDKIAEIQANENAVKASAESKLTALGLTPEEIAALRG